MELSMLIAIVAAAAIGEWLTALVVTAFVLAAEILEDLSVKRGHDALTDLMAFLPQTVRIREGERGAETIGRRRGLEGFERRSHREIQAEGFKRRGARRPAPQTRLASAPNPGRAGAETGATPE